MDCSCLFTGSPQGQKDTPHQFNVQTFRSTLSTQETVDSGKIQDLTTKVRIGPDDLSELLKLRLVQAVFEKACQEFFSWGNGSEALRHDDLPVDALFERLTQPQQSDLERAHARVLRPRQGGEGYLPLVFRD